MLKSERQQEIINILKTENYASVQYISKVLFTSPSSVRRDLSNLEKQRLIKRTPGGAELISPSTAVAPFNERTYHNTDAKKTIAKKAATLVSDGDIIFLDQSSTSFFLAAELMKKSLLTVITNNIEILNLLSQTEITVYSSGGMLSSRNRNCLIGIDTADIFKNTFADAVFFSAKALSDDGVVSDCTREEVLVRDAMLKNARKKVFLCDSTKFGTGSGYKQCTLDDVDVLVTETDGLKKIASSFKNLTVI